MTDIPALTNDIGKIASALGLFASAIKSGEHWTETCSKAQANAHEALKRLGEALSSLTAPPPEEIAALIERAYSQIWANDPIIKKLAAALKRMAREAELAKSMTMEAHGKWERCMDRIRELEAERDARVSVELLNIERETSCDRLRAERDAARSETEDLPK